MQNLLTLPSSTPNLSANYAVIFFDAVYGSRSFGEFHDGIFAAMLAYSRNIFNRSQTAKVNICLRFGFHDLSNNEFRSASADCPKFYSGPEDRHGHKRLRKRTYRTLRIKNIPQRIPQKMKRKHRDKKC
jgi:hypothetical protein